MTLATMTTEAVEMRRTDVRASAGAADTAAAAAHHIQITIAGGTARLTGQVSSWIQRRDIGRAVGDAPGVLRVDNRLEVVRSA